MPVWGRLRSLSELFASLETAVVASTYCNSWLFPALDSQRPLESMARAYSEIFIVRSEGYKEMVLAEACRHYRAEGILFHEARTCPPNSNTRFGLPERLQRAWGLPTLVLDGDLNDLRCFSDEQARTNIETFVELLR